MLCSRPEFAFEGPRGAGGAAGGGRGRRGGHGGAGAGESAHGARPVTLDQAAQDAPHDAHPRYRQERGPGCVVVVVVVAVPLLLSGFPLFLDGMARIR